MATKTFDTLQQDITSMLRGDTKTGGGELHYDSAQRIVTLAKNVALHTLEMVNHQPPKPKDTKDHSIRCSELGEPCVRKLMYKWYHPMAGLPPYSEAPDPYLPVKFTYGDMVEELVLFMAEEAGHSVTHRQHECTISLGVEDWYLKGHMDAVIDGVVVDVKSAADVSFQKYQREGLTPANDKFGYIYQLDSYAMMDSFNNRRAFIFSNKHDGRIHIIDRTPELFVDVASKAKQIISAATRVDETLGAVILPARLPTEPTKYGEQLGVVCSYCPFKYTCYYGDITGYISSGRPSYLRTSSMTPQGGHLVSTKTQIKRPEAAYLRI